MHPIEIPERYTVTVVLPAPDGKPRATVVEGRVAKIIAWLIQHRARVERVGNGSLTFNMSLRMIQPDLRDSFPPLHATPDDPRVSAGKALLDPDESERILRSS